MVNNGVKRLIFIRHLKPQCLKPIFKASVLYRNKMYHINYIKTILGLILPLTNLCDFILLFPGSLFPRFFI